MHLIAFGAIEDALAFSLDFPVSRITHCNQEANDSRTILWESTVCSKALRPKEGFRIFLARDCPACHSKEHYVISKSIFRDVLETEVSKRSIYVEEYEDVQIDTSGTDLYLIRNGRKSRLTEDVIIFADDLTLAWKSRVNLPLSIHTVMSQNQISFWTATFDKDVHLPDNGVIQHADDTLIWLKVGHGRLKVAVIAASDKHITETVRCIFASKKYELQKVSPYSMKRKRNGFLKSFTKYTFMSSLKRWIVLYAQAWFKVALSVFFVSRVRLFTLYGVFFEVQMLLFTTIKYIRSRGFVYALIRFIKRYLKVFFILERRVRAATSSKFISLSFVLSLAQVMLMEIYNRLYQIYRRVVYGPALNVQPLVEQLSVDLKHPRVQVIIKCNKVLPMGPIWSAYGNWKSEDTTTGIGIPNVH